MSVGSFMLTVGQGRGQGGSSAPRVPLKPKYTTTRRHSNQHRSNSLEAGNEPPPRRSLVAFVDDAVKPQLGTTIAWPAGGGAGIALDLWGVSRGPRGRVMRGMGLTFASRHRTQAVFRLIRPGSTGRVGPGRDPGSGPGPGVSCPVGDSGDSSFGDPPCDMFSTYRSRPSRCEMQTGDGE